MRQISNHPNNNIRAGLNLQQLKKNSSRHSAVLHCGCATSSHGLKCCIASMYMLLQNCLILRFMSLVNDVPREVKPITLFAHYSKQVYFYIVSADINIPLF
jgi:hypothetical protein